MKISLVIYLYWPIGRRRDFGSGDVISGVRFMNRKSGLAGTLPQSAVAGLPEGRVLCTLLLHGSIRPVAAPSCPWDASRSTWLVVHFRLHQKTKTSPTPVS